MPPAIALGVMNPTSQPMSRATAKSSDDRSPGWSTTTAARRPAYGPIASRMSRSPCSTPLLATTSPVSAS